MSLQFTELRQAIYQTKEEFQRFRQLMVNAVLATDIMDKELKALRNSRWEKTFADDNKSQEGAPDSDHNEVNRKATIVIEHIIQAVRAKYLLDTPDTLLLPRFRVDSVDPALD